MSDKMKNFIVRAITGVLFVAAIVTCFLRPEAMILLFALVTGLTIWEFTGIVNDIEGVTTNRLITTVAGLIVAMILQVFYNYILAKIDSITVDMEDSSISLIDSLTKYNAK